MDPQMILEAVRLLELFGAVNARIWTLIGMDLVSSNNDEGYMVTE